MIFLGEHIIDLQGCRIEDLNLIFPVRNPRFSILVSIQGFRRRLLPRADICQMWCVVYVGSAYEVRHAALAAGYCFDPMAAMDYRRP
jgi:hypothetical protein